MVARSHNRVCLSQDSNPASPGLKAWPFSALSCRQASPCSLLVSPERSPFPAAPTYLVPHPHPHPHHHHRCDPCPPPVGLLPLALLPGLSSLFLC